MTYQEAQDRRKATSKTQLRQLRDSCQQRGSHPLIITASNVPQAICAECFTTFAGGVAVDPPDEATGNSEA